MLLWGKIRVRNFGLIIIFLCPYDVMAIENNWDVLNQYNIQIDQIEDGDGVPGVRAAFIVDASREKIWSILVDYKNFKKYFPNIEKIEVLNEDKYSAIIDFTLDGVFNDVQYVLKRNYTKVGHELRWNRHSGDMDVIHGSWRIEDIADLHKKLVIYESYVDFGNFFITWIIQQFATEKANEMAIRLRSWMEKPK